MRTVLFCLTAMAAAACQPEDSGSKADAAEHHSHLEEAAEHACTHFLTGAPQPVSATDQVGTATQEITPGHHLFAVTLTDFAGAKGGYLKFSPGEEMEIVLFSNRDMPIALEHATDGDLTPQEQLQQPETCVAISLVAAYHLEPDEYALRLGPTSLNTVDLLVEHHDH